MKLISGKETKPEIIVRKILFAKGYRYRKNVTSLPGKPDIVLKKYQTVILVNGCFWHGHNCKAAKLPTTNATFWREKILGNIQRDKRNAVKLRKLNWRIIKVWQCQITSKIKLTETADRILSELQNTDVLVKNKIKPL